MKQKVDRKASHRSSTASESFQLRETEFAVFQFVDAQVEQEEHGERIENPVDQVSDVEVASLASDDLRDFNDESKPDCAEAENAEDNTFRGRGC